MAGIVIVGAGHAGSQLAISLRDEGYEGTIDLISADPDHPYHKPPLSKSFMKTPDAGLQPFRAQQVFDDKGITLQLGQQVLGIDREKCRVRLADGYPLDYATLVLATGTEARPLTLPGSDHAGVFTLRTAADARRLRAALPGAQRIVVIGGGFIGLETAAMLSARGLDVAVVEIAPRLLGRAASAAMASAVEHALIETGVRVLAGAKIERIVGKPGRVDGVLLENRTLPADLVIAGIGAVPVVGLAEDAGLSVDNGIVVDAHLATSDPAIFALGDCASFPMDGARMRLESVQNATDQARTLAKTLSGRPADYSAVPWFWSDIGTLKLQIAGLSAGADASVESFTPEGRLKSVYHLRAGQLIAVETINSGGEHMLARQMLAAGFTPATDLMRQGDPRAIKAAFQGIVA